MNEEIATDIFLIEPSLIDFWQINDDEAFVWFANPLTPKQLDELRVLGLEAQPLTGALQGRYRLIPADSLDTSELSK